MKALGEIRRNIERIGMAMYRNATAMRMATVMATAIEDSLRLRNFAGALDLFNMDSLWFMPVHSTLVASVWALTYLTVKQDRPSIKYN
jgi:hypothetical protein